MSRQGKSAIEGIWRNQRPTCELVVRRQVSDCEPNLDFHYERGVYDGPLYIWSNSNTASATEDLVGRLKESGAATLIGARTYGAGCGFTNGGIPLKLKHLGLSVQISDCVRYLRTGANEVLGIEPDVALPDAPLGSPMMTNAFKGVLSR